MKNFRDTGADLLDPLQAWLAFSRETRVLITRELTHALTVPGDISPKVLKELKKRGIWLAGTSDKVSESLYSTDLTGPLALVMGSEGSG